MKEKRRCMLFFDIDGTLITEDGTMTFPDSAKQAIRKARENGHLVYINTGRVRINVDDFIEEVGFDGFVCGCGTYIESEGAVLLHHETPQNRCVEIAKKCRECKLFAVFEHADKNGYDQAALGDINLHVLEYFKSMGRKMVPDIEDPEFSFDKFAAWYDKESAKLEEFKQFVSEDFTCITREGTFIEVVPKGFSKATGIRFLMERYGIPLADVYAFGDSNNDLDMLRYVEHSIAMGVCSDEVAKVASYRTDTVMQDGIYNAMKHFELI